MPKTPTPAERGAADAEWGQNDGFIAAHVPNERRAEVLAFVQDHTMPDFLVTNEEYNEYWVGYMEALK